jgi:hypothetical protein
VEKFVAKMLIAAVVAAICAVLGEVIPLDWMHWWVAGLIGLAVAFGGWFIIVDWDIL